MTVRVVLPVNFERAPLPERLRFFANVTRGFRHPNPQLIADLEEAACEIELGERTKLTFRGAGPAR